MNRAVALVACGVLATALAASWPARADTISFQCGVSLVVDLTNSAVNDHPATINGTAIDWRVMPGVADDSGVLDYHLDRGTGILAESFTYRLADGSTRRTDGPTAYHCTVGGAPPAKP